jgi:hypothetical protein
LTISTAASAAKAHLPRFELLECVLVVEDDELMEGRPAHLNPDRQLDDGGVSDHAFAFEHFADPEGAAEDERCPADIWHYREAGRLIQHLLQVRVLALHLLQRGEHLGVQHGAEICLLVQRLERLLQRLERAAHGVADRFDRGFQSLDELRNFDMAASGLAAPGEWAPSSTRGSLN